MAFDPSFELYVLLKRVERGDVEAIEEAWPLLFDRPDDDSFDKTRPVTQILLDVAERITEISTDAKSPPTGVEDPSTDDLTDEELADYLIDLAKKFFSDEIEGNSYWKKF